MHNLKLKTQPKQLLGYLPSAFALPYYVTIMMGKNIGKEACILKTSYELLTISILDGVYYR